jgi:hypothetical protein
LKGRAGFAHQSANRSAHLDVFAADALDDLISSVPTTAAGLRAMVSYLVGERNRNE